MNSFVRRGLDQEPAEGLEKARVEIKKGIGRIDHERTERAAIIDPRLAALRAIIARERGAAVFAMRQRLCFLLRFFSPTEAPFAGRKPIFIGDDVTDEAGFEAVQAHGGFGIKVGPEPSCARFRLDSPDAVRAALAQALQLL